MSGEEWQSRASEDYWARATRDIQARLDELERQAKLIGSTDTLSDAMQLEGFADWPDVERLARDHNHRVAIELLCRHRQRSGS